MTKIKTPYSNSEARKKMDELYIWLEKVLDSKPRVEDVVDDALMGLRVAIQVASYHIDRKMEYEQEIIKMRETIQDMKSEIDALRSNSVINTDEKINLEIKITDSV